MASIATLSGSSANNGRVVRGAEDQLRRADDFLVEVDDKPRNRQLVFFRELKKYLLLILAKQNITELIWMVPVLFL